MEGTQRGKTKEQTKQRESEATSKKTLQEVQESEKAAEVRDRNSRMPSPDGSFDETDELADADPI